MSEYRTLFDARGSRYNGANRLFPEARAEESERILAHLELAQGTRWLDVGAGGGFLAERTAAAGLASQPVACDASAAFLAEATAYALRTVADYERLPFGDHAFGAAGCLAVLHHAEDPEPVLREMLRVTAPGGRIAVGDVAAGTRAARFLNGFVDSHTDTGHAGRFYDAGALGDLLGRAGGTLARTEEIELSWKFAGRSDARHFCRELFGLRPDTQEPDLEAGLNWLGLTASPEGCRLAWGMVFASAAAP